MVEADREEERGAEQKEQAQQQRHGLPEQEVLVDKVAMARDELARQHEARHHRQQRRGREREQLERRRRRRPLVVSIMAKQLYTVQ